MAESQFTLWGQSDPCVNAPVLMILLSRLACPMWSARAFLEIHCLTSIFQRISFPLLRPADRAFTSNHGGHHRR